MRRYYLAARRRGLTQTEARKETGVSRASSWRWDKLLKAEEPQRAAVRERYNQGQPTNDDDALSAAVDQGTELSGPATIPMPPWHDSRPARPADDPLADEGSYPSGLLERRQRPQGERELPRGHPMLRGRAVTVAHGAMPESQDMSGRLSRPARLSEEQSPGILPL
jgi:hypothetical protein